MADRIEKIVDIKVNAKGAKNVDKNFKEINKGLKDIEKQAEKAFSPAPAKKLNDEIKKTEKVTVDVRQKLRDLQNRMAEIGDVGSAEFQQLAAEAGKYKDQMNNANAAIKSMSADFPKMALIGGGLQALGGAAQGATGAMMLFGTENEEAAKAIQKMMAIQQVMNSVTVMSNSLSDESALGLKVRTVLTNLKAKASKKDVVATGAQTVAQSALTIATNIGSVAMAALNAVMNLNPVFLLITGIAALGAAMYAFSDSAEDAAVTNEKLNKQLDDLVAKRDLVKEAISTNEDIRRRELLLSGATAEELHEDEIKRIEQKELLRKNDMKAIEFSNQALYASNKLLQLQGKNDEIEANEDKIKANRDTYNKLVLNAKNYSVEIREENKKFNEQEVKDQEAQDAKKLANQKAYQAKRKALKEFNLATLRKIEDEELIYLQEGRERDLEKQRLDFTRRLEDLKADKRLSSEQLLALDMAATEKNRIAIEKINKKYDDIEDKRREERLKKQHAALTPPSAPDFIDPDGIVEVNAEKFKNEQLLSLQEKYNQASLKLSEELEEGKLKGVMKGLSIAAKNLSALGDLSASITEAQIAAAGDDEEKKEKIRKKAFERDKALQLSQAIVLGISATLGAFKDGNAKGGPVLGAIQAAIAAATSMAQISKIKNTNYESGDPGDLAPPEGGNAQVPQFNVVGGSTANQLAQSLGQNQAPLKAFVVAGDVTTAQELDRDKIQLSGL